MQEYEKPWQVMPAKIIVLAKEQASKDTDFDGQLAFLLLDIGVEAALKTYLINKKQDVEKILFPDLIKKVKEELTKENLVVDLESLEYYHRIRNKLYHQGDGVRPTDENLQRYLVLAEDVLKTLLAIDISKLESSLKSAYSVWDETWKTKRTFDDLASELKERLRYFHESCALIAEQLRPNYATRKFELEFINIREEHKHRSFGNEDTIEDAQEKVRLANERLHLFNELTKMRFADHDFADFMLENINHLYVGLVFDELAENPNDGWNRYVDIFYVMASLPEKWESGIDDSLLDTQKVSLEHREIVSWLEEKQSRIDNWINVHLPNIRRSGPKLYLELL